MSISMLVVSAETFLPFFRTALVAAGAAAFALRPLVGLGLLAALVWLFKPLLLGIGRAALMAIWPRHSFAERSQRRAVQGIVMLNTMARELDTQQPNLAAELRLLAARG